MSTPLTEAFWQNRSSSTFPSVASLVNQTLNNAKVNAGRASYVLEHQINENCKFRNAFGAVFGQIRNNEIGLVSLGDDRRTIERYIDRTKEFSENYTLQNEITGKFRTGSIQHQLLVGLDLSRYRFS
jgi:iron complex outermembrane recepter protein